MKHKGWLIFGVIAVLGLGVYVAASPLMTFNAMSEAAEAGDITALEKTVDFPAVRTSLKDQLNARLIGALNQDRALTDGPFGALGALLGPAIVNQVVEAAVTPQGVAAIVRSGRAPLSDIQPGSAVPPPPAEPVTAATADNPKRSTRFAYLDLNHFRAQTVTTDNPGQPLGWVLERRNIVGWKLVRIELPPQ